MSNYIPDEIVDEVRNSSDIVDVISNYVRLKLKGRNYVGLCPFHTEKTGSFTVNREKQIYHCFGCGEGGNVFSFIMRKENLSFPEAVKMLAERTGITVPEGEDDPAQTARLRKREEAFSANELTRDFYHYILMNHETAGEARQYLNKRGISNETAEEFQLGYAPPSWDGLLSFMTKKGYKPDNLERLGLVLAKTKGTSGYYDRFRNRIMFPIWDPRGRVAGFGGRVMDDSLPKYLNSPETIVFNKSHLLYGINKAAENIRQLDQVIIVEGYMDVITCHQTGIRNVVASLGTAFAREQGKLLQRYTREVIIAYDADSAGTSATLRGWQLLDDIGCRVKIVRIPDGKDPDEFIKSHGQGNFLHLVNEKGQSLSDYMTDRSMEKFDIYTLEGKFKVASEVIPSIRNMSNEIEKDEAIQKLAQRLHLSPDAIRSEVEKSGRKSRNSWANRDKITGVRDNNNKSSEVKNRRPTVADARSKAEDSLLALMLEDRDTFVRVKNEIGVNFSSRQEYLNIVGLLNEMAQNESEYQPAALFDRLTDKDTTGLLNSLTMIEMPAEDRKTVIRDCLKTIKDDEQRKKREELLKQMEEADRLQDQELRQKLLMEYSKLI